MITSGSAGLSENNGEKSVPWYERPAVATLLKSLYLRALASLGLLGWWQTLFLAKFEVKILLFRRDTGAEGDFS